MVKLKHYRSNKYYRFDSIIESIIVVIFFKLFVKRPKLKTWKAFLYKKPIKCTLYYNNFAFFFIYLKILFLKIFFKKEIILTTEKQIEKNERGNDSSLWPVQPTCQKSNKYNFSNDIDFQNKILDSYHLANEKDDLNFEKGEWWKSNSIFIKELFLKDKKLNINNIENFLSLDYNFALFNASTPLKKKKSIKKLNLAFGMILDYHRFSDYIDSEILQNVSESNVGGIEAPIYRNQIISPRILTLGYVISQIKKYTFHDYDSEFRFMDIGGGFGNLSRLIMNFFNKSKCILIDLPEVCITSAYYLKANFPQKKIVLFSEAFKSGSFDIDVINDSDVLIIPSWAIKYLPDDFVNLSVNTSSLGEMSKDYGNFFIKNMSRITKNYFYSSNRTESKGSIWDGFGHYEYKFEDKWLPIIYQNSPTWHLEYLGKKIKD